MADLTPADDIARIIPVERALIGACMYPGATIPPLAPEEFALDRHRLIWGSMLRLLVLDSSVSLVTVMSDLCSAGESESAGGPAHLALCFEEAHIEAYVVPLARQVREAARGRALRQLGLDLARQGFSESEIEARLAELPGSLSGPIFDPAHEWREIVASWKIGRIKTRFTGLDALTGGLGGGDFIVVGGRTSQGKTSWLCDLTLRLTEQGIPTEYITLEESSASITRRMVANRTGVPMRRLKDGTVSQAEFADAEAAVRWLQEQPLTVTGLDHLKTLEEDAIVGAMSSSDAAVVILDHLQQVTTPGKESRVYGLDRVLKRLQAVALRDKKVVILAAQLGRDIDARQGPPRLSDLRDSGGIEMAGRHVYLLYWPCKYDPKRSSEEYELYVAKQMDGGTGMVTLKFEAHLGRFHNVTA